MSLQQWPSLRVCFLPFSGSGQEDELGYEEDILPVEGSGAGGNQHCCSLQLPGSTGHTALLSGVQGEL